MGERYFFEYKASLRLVADISRIAAPADEFYTLIMTAMRLADTDNLEKLRAAFPDVYNELIARYNAPGGALTPEEMSYLKSWGQNTDPDEGEE